MGENQMWTAKMITAMTLGGFLFCVNIAVGCGAKTNPPSLPSSLATPAGEDEQVESGKLKVLGAGAHSSIQDGFVAVIRDAATYAELRKLDRTVPKLADDFFSTDAVVAAFLGERRTGGYSVDITENAGAINVIEKKPGKDMMVTQMITAPFKIVAVAGAANSSLSLTVDTAWQQRLLPFKISSGHFKVTGGFAGTMRDFDLEGDLRIVMEGSSLATFVFGLRGTDPTQERVMREAATGMVTADGHVTIKKMNSGSLIDLPHGGLTVTGQFSDSDSKIDLSFLSLPSVVADGYSGTGTISAMITNARPGSR
jgi:hypothetical protein